MPVYKEQSIRAWCDPGMILTHAC